MVNEKNALQHVSDAVKRSLELITTEHSPDHNMSRSHMNKDELVKVLFNNKSNDSSVSLYWIKTIYIKKVMFQSI